MAQLDLSIRRLMRLITYTLLMAASLAGCALNQAPTRPEVLDQALPPTTHIPASWEEQAGAGPVADNWISLFNDPALDAIVAEAMAYNLDLRQAAERVSIAQQYVIQAGASLAPYVDLQAGANTLRDKDQNSNYNSMRTFGTVGWELDVWGRVRSQKAAAEAEFYASELDYAYARQSLAALVAKSWYLVIETRQLLELADSSVDVFEKLLELVKIRLDTGKDSNLNVVDLAAAVAAAKGDREVARQSYSKAQRSLEVLLGRYPAAELKGAAEYPQLPPAVGADVPASLLQRRPDILASERMVLAAFRTTEAARLARLPSFGISLGGGRLDDQLLSLLQLNPWLATAGIGMDIPIFEGGALQAEVEIATSQQAQLVAAYGATVLNAFNEVETALFNEANLARQIEFSNMELANRTAAVDIATVQFLAGSQDLLWVARLQTQQIESATMATSLRAAQGQNRIQLYLALGGSFNAAIPVSSVTKADGGSNDTIVINQLAANPAAVYCEEQGNSFSVSNGDCQLADGTEVNAWDYFRRHHSDN